MNQRISAMLVKVVTEMCMKYVLEHSLNTSIWTEKSEGSPHSSPSPQLGSWWLSLFTKLDLASVGECQAAQKPPAQHQTPHCKSTTSKHRHDLFIWDYKGKDRQHCQRKMLWKRRRHGLYDEFLVNATDKILKYDIHFHLFFLHGLFRSFFFIYE